MGKINWFAATAALTLTLGPASTAAATAARVWVSGHGADAAGCGAPTDPCRSLQYAHDNAVNFGGEIDVLDPAGYGALTITKSISIVNDGVGTAGVQATSGIAININAGATDSVYLRGLNVDGVNFAGSTGIQFNTGARLTIANCVVRHFANYGIALAPAGIGTARINISDTASSDNHGGGMLLRPPTAPTYANLVIDHMTAQGNSADGMSIDGNGTTGNVVGYVANSNFSNNTGDGIKIQSTGNNVVVTYVDRSQIDANSSSGVEAITAASLWLSNSSAWGNLSFDLNNGGGGGAGITTFGNNMFGSQTGNALTHSPTG